MKDNSTVRCRICHRSLSNPISRALGIGPKCAGERSGGGRMRVRVKIRHSSSNSHATGMSKFKTTLISVNVPTAKDKLTYLLTVPLGLKEFRSELATMERSSRKALRVIRTSMFFSRERFCSGMFLSGSKEQCVFEPVGEDCWYEVHTPDRLQKADDLESYLKRIGILAQSWRKGQFPSKSVGVAVQP